MFGMCSIFLFVASLLQRRLMMIVDKPSMLSLCPFASGISICSSTLSAYDQYTSQCFAETNEWTQDKERITEEDPLNI